MSENTQLLKTTASNANQALIDVWKIHNSIVNKALIDVWKYTTLKKLQPPMLTKHSLMSEKYTTLKNYSLQC